MSRDRYPRTLQEAFGPYTSSDFDPDPRSCYFKAFGEWLVRLFGWRNR